MTNFCPNCGSKVTETTNFCPVCGYQLNNSNGNNKKSIISSEMNNKVQHIWKDFKPNQARLANFKKLINNNKMTVIGITIVDLLILFFVSHWLGFLLALITLVAIYYWSVSKNTEKLVPEKKLNEIFRSTNDRKKASSLSTSDSHNMELQENIQTDNVSTDNAKQTVDKSLLTIKTASIINLIAGFFILYFSSNGYFVKLSESLIGNYAGGVTLAQLCKNSSTILSANYSAMLPILIISTFVCVALGFVNNSLGLVGASIVAWIPAISIGVIMAKLLNDMKGGAHTEFVDLTYGPSMWLIVVAVIALLASSIIATIDNNKKG